MTTQPRASHYSFARPALCIRNPKHHNWPRTVAMREGNSRIALERTMAIWAARCAG